MTVNLDAELARFKVRVKEEKVAKVEHRKGYSGGSISYYLLVLLFVVLTRKLTRTKKSCLFLLRY
jgi:rhombotail lipoprotein